MTGIVITIEVKPSNELMLLADALIERLDKLLEYHRGGAAQHDGAVQVARDDAEPHKATEPDQRTHHAGSAGDRDSKAPVLPVPIPKAPPVGAQPDTSSAAPPRAEEWVRTETPKPAAAAVTSPTSSAAGGSSRWVATWATDERKAVLARMYPSSATSAEIMTALANLPGPPLPQWKTVQVYAIQSLRLHKTPDAKAEINSKRTGAASTVRHQPNRLAAALELPKESVDTKTPIVADFETIRAWAGPRGVQFNTWADLAAVNECADRIGHRPFEREMPARRVA